MSIIKTAYWQSSILAILMLVFTTFAEPDIALAGGGGGGADGPGDSEAVAEVAPGESGSVPSNPNGYTALELNNLGPGPVEVVIKSAAFSKTFTIKSGDSIKLTEIFGPGNIDITNKSAAATVKIQSKWL